MTSASDPHSRAAMLREQAAFARDVDHDLRSERLRALWRRYAWAIIGTVVAVVAVVAAIQGVRAWRTKLQLRDAAAYEKALGKGDGEADSAALTALAARASDGYRDLARLQAAAALERAGRVDDALAMWDAQYQDPKADPTLADAARFLYASRALNAGKNPKTITSVLAPLLNPANAFYYLASELRGLISLKTGDLEHAKSIFEGLSASSRTPPPIRRRAQEMMMTFTPLASPSTG